MKIPDKVKIGGHWIEVRVVSEKDGLTKTGQGHAWNNTIHIQADMMATKQESTLLHETLHEMNWQHEWGLSENQISAIAETFYQFLVDNGFLK